MDTQLQLSEIPQPLFELINGKREVQLFTKRGEIKTIYFMRGIYRVYFKNNSGGSGEYRFTPEEASEITVSIL